ncbi:MAG: phosphopentomutase [Clostridia bacterium]|nr:phosphopentomutase [Clostridia bacterium]
MKSIDRVFLIVLDSVGAGYSPDAADFGDVGANTLLGVWKTQRLNIPNLISLGLGNIEGLSFLGNTDFPRARIARMTEASAGKDTTIGHWEIAGHVSVNPLPTFPEGFPFEVIKSLEDAFDREVICNKPYSGTKVLCDYGDEHVTSGKPIIYTSADSVLQIAAHTDIVPIEQLYFWCEQARKIMQGERFGVGRIIARPFEGVSGEYRRTADRRDFSLAPPENLLPDIVKKNRLDCISVGKIEDIFAGRGFMQGFHTHSNREGMEICSKLANTDFRGLCFVNLVDFDMMWGHRRDAVAYAEGLNEFDEWLGGFLKTLGQTDMLIITADHGCDPSFEKTTDHTREYTPCIIYGQGVSAKNMGTRTTFADIGATVAKALGIDFKCDGTSMI